MRHLLAATLVLAALLLAACGFRPLHQAANPASLASGPLRAVDIDVISADDSDDERAAFLINRALEARLRTNVPARYRLEVIPAVSRAGLGVSPNDVATRYDYRIFARFTLTDTDTGERLMRDQVYAVSSFGAPADPYGRIAAELSAAELASQDAADRIFTELALYFATPEDAEG